LNLDKKTEKILEEWKQKKPKEERFDTAVRVLEKCGFVCVSKGKKKGSSHFVFKHTTLTEIYRKFPKYLSKDFAPNGSLNVVYDHGKTTEFYIKNIVKAVEAIKEYEEIVSRKKGGH